jgi:RNA polymerase sigma-70 factor, ECF subfamily
MKTAHTDVGSTDPLDFAGFDYPDKAVRIPGSKAEITAPNTSSAGLPQVSALLKDWSRGDTRALDELTPLVYLELRRVACKLFRSERPGHVLQPTALVNEAYLQLLGHVEKEWHDRSHFFAVASRLMRNILVDHARQQLRQKRGGGVHHLAIDAVVNLSAERSHHLLALDEALKRLSETHPRKARIVEMHFFGGLALSETAVALGVATITVQRDWIFAKAWLQRELEGTGSSFKPPKQ